MARTSTAQWRYPEKTALSRRQIGESNRATEFGIGGAALLSICLFSPLKYGSRRNKPRYALRTQLRNCGMFVADSAAQQHYSTAVEGNVPVRRRYTITGRFDASAYIDFIAERARWLAIDGWVASAAEGAVQLVAAGPEALVGALEMACVLGPLDALVETVSVRDEPDGNRSGFKLR
jgi:acylphosphatase